MSSAVWPQHGDCQRSEVISVVLSACHSYAKQGRSNQLICQQNYGIHLALFNY